MSELKALPRDRLASYGIHAKSKYLGATDFRPSRVKATAVTPFGTFSVTESWSHDGDSSEEHFRVMTALCAKLAAANEYAKEYRITSMAFDDSDHPGYFFTLTQIYGGKDDN